MKSLIGRYIDGFVAGLLGVAVLGLLLPTSGQVADILGWASKVGIGLLFLLYGARLSTHEVLAGMRRWRLHLTILSLSFVCFPVLGVTIGAVFDDLMPADLVTGLVFVTLISATTQTSVSNTAIAGGNVPAAIIATSASSVLGVFITPLLVAATLATTGATHIDPRAVIAIVAQLLVPFLAGQLIQPRIGGVLRRKRRDLMRIDRALILFVVFAAFSKGSGAGIWGAVSLSGFVLLLAVCGVLLAVVLALAFVAGKALGFSRDDRAVVTFVGSSKSVAVGLPMATVLFTGNQTALIILPLMCFFQLQTIVCSFVAQRWGWGAQAEGVDEQASSASSPALKELHHRLQLYSSDQRTFACIFGEGDELRRTSPETLDLETCGTRHDDAHMRRQPVARMGVFAAGSVGALVLDAAARPAVERFATSTRAVDDELRLIDELRSAGTVDAGPDGDESLAMLLAAVGESPIRVVGHRLPTNTDIAATVNHMLAAQPPGKKIAVLVGAVETEIAVRPGDAIYYPQYAYSSDAVHDNPTAVYPPSPQRQLARP